MMDKNTPPEDDVLESDKQCILLRSFWRQFLSWKSRRLPLYTVTVVMLAQFDPTAAPSLGGRLPFLFPVSCVAGGFVEGGAAGREEGAMASGETFAFAAVLPICALGRQNRQRFVGHFN